jgi:2,4-dienoyl-CoA reductase-like NADH-dependent reductase (Old Yellow Enzyme family)
LLDGADVTALFTPVSVADLKLRNRLVMAPMTRQFSPDGIPGDDVAAYYGRRASSLGLLITEGTYVDEGAGDSDRVPRFYGERSLAGARSSQLSTPRTAPSSRSCGISGRPASRVPGHSPTLR